MNPWGLTEMSPEDNSEPFLKAMLLESLSEKDFTSCMHWPHFGNKYSKLPKGITSFKVITTNARDLSLITKQDVKHFILYDGMSWLVVWRNQSQPGCPKMFEKIYQEITSWDDWEE